MTGTSDNFKVLILSLAAGVLTGLFLLLFVNRGVLHHRESMGYRELREPEAAVVINHDGSAAIAFNQAEQGVYIERLSFDVEALREKPQSIVVQVTCLTEGSGPQTFSYTDFNPLYVGREVLRIGREHVIYIGIFDAAGSETEDVTGDPHFRVGAAAVDNRFSFSPYVLLFGFLMGAVTAWICRKRRFFRERPAAVFLVIALSAGTVMVCTLPRNKVGYDEETHLQAVMDLASFPSHELHVSDAVLYEMLITEYNHPDAQPGGALEMQEFDTALDLRSDYREGTNTPQFTTLPNRVPAYIAMAAAIKLGKGLHLPFTRIWMLARFANLLQYTLVMALAIRLLPYGRWLMILIGLFPTNLFLACTISYDPFITAFLSLGYAFLLKGRKYLVPAELCIFLGSLAKAVYAPVALLGLPVLLQPVSCFAERESVRTVITNVKSTSQKANFGNPCLEIQTDAQDGDNCHQTEKHRVLSNIRRALPGLLLCTLVFLLLIGSFILPSVLSPAETGDVRGGATSEISQVGFILQNPLLYARILILQILRWVPQCWFGPDCMTYMGHLVNGETAFRGLYGAYCVLLLTVILTSWLSAGSDGNPKIHASVQIAGRIWTVLMVGAASVLIWTSMYVAFTEPGATEIAGVQGRYFLPLFFPLYMALSGPLESRRPLWYDLWDLALLLLTALTLWASVLVPFGL